MHATSSVMAVVARLLTSMAQPFVYPPVRHDKPLERAALAGCEILAAGVAMVHGRIVTPGALAGRHRRYDELMP